MTLIKSNPAFKQQRADYFFVNYNPKNKTVEEVVSIFRHVDIMSNAINEKTGGNIDAEEMYLMVIYQLTGVAEMLKEINVEKLYAKMEELVLEHMPSLYNQATKDVLAEIKLKKEVTFNILSNTAFIKGCTLRKVLRHLQIENYFDFQIYSDEAGCSKPNRKIFELLLEQITVTKKEPILPAQVIHIGDNIFADVAAAKAMGIAAFQINSNDLLITDLLN